MTSAAARGQRLLAAVVVCAGVDRGRLPSSSGAHGAGDAGARSTAAAAAQCRTGRSRGARSRFRSSRFRRPHRPGAAARAAAESAQRCGPGRAAQTGTGRRNSPNRLKKCGRRRPPCRRPPADREGELERRIRASLKTAADVLNRVDYRKLNADVQLQYDTREELHAPGRGRAENQESGVRADDGRQSGGARGTARSSVALRAVSGAGLGLGAPGARLQRHPAQSRARPQSEP